MSTDTASGSVAHRMTASGSSGHGDSGRQKGREIRSRGYSTRDLTRDMASGIADAIKVKHVCRTSKFSSEAARRQAQLTPPFAESEYYAPSVSFSFAKKESDFSRQERKKELRTYTNNRTFNAVQRNKSIEIGCRGTSDNTVEIFGAFRELDDHRRNNRSSMICDGPGKKDAEVLILR
ncbi:hypothetical protein K435DRAFT_809642 [Dendrothele bispora CBS 962.96]|uniref:Uncharacterized protein n=1 Tax=Dendrothele bispora (strain CBS 962.96) TaxID=1314807 RepID=A0A4S8KXK6_DENBC|nr:hypothetical protein K435DRAFT_809642 [Dendrothele bispora CBS 962.96]